VPQKVLYDRNPSMFRRKPALYSLMVLLAVGGYGCAIYFAVGGEPVAQFPFLAHAASVFATYGALVLGYWWLRGKGTRLTLTDSRITLKRGILARNITEVYHSDVRNVQLNQTFLQRVFDVGSVGISSAGQAGMEIYVEGVPDPDGVKSIIDQYRTTDGDASKRAGTRTDE
jgi:uncharacterized membrane protein YdbT with pleckstrin-like domain